MDDTWWTQPEHLDDDQKKVVALPAEGNHLVLGPPGSGKTNLLVLRGTFLYSNKVRNIVVLTFGRVLREFLVAGAKNYPFPADKVQTYVRWGASILRENGITLNENGKFEEVRARLLEGLQQVAARGGKQNVFDCILIDEAQDYSVAEMEVICAFATQVFAVGDTRQRIFDSNGAIDYLKKMCGDASALRYHYRNGIKVCRVADGIRNMLDDPEGLEASSNYDEAAFPSSVEIYSGQQISGQVATAIPQISTQLRAYPNGIIGVLCPRQVELQEVWQVLVSSTLESDVQLQRYQEGYLAFDPERRVIVTTLHGAKGLEFRAVHMLGMDKISKFPLQKNMAFTGVTRAKTSVAVYHEGSLPGYLEKGLAATEPPLAEPVSLTSLFGSL